MGRPIEIWNFYIFSIFCVLLFVQRWVFFLRLFMLAIFGFFFSIFLKRFLLVDVVVVFAVYMGPYWDISIPFSVFSSFFSFTFASCSLRFSIFFYFPHHLFTKKDGLVFLFATLLTWHNYLVLSCVLSGFGFCFDFILSKLESILLCVCRWA